MLLSKRINSIKGLSATKPQGAFYCFISIQDLLGKTYESEVIRDSLVLTDLLLTKVFVAVVPGSVFGDDNYLRLSYATSMENVKEGLNRIEEFTSKVI